ncbi:hypothetical protein VaNZ11_013896, partial [Volvox africanus]
MQPARDFPAFGEADVIGGGFRVSSFPSNAGYNRHIANQPPQQRSHDRLEPRLLTHLTKQRFTNRSNSYAQYGPYVYHEILPSAGDQAEPTISQEVHASISPYGNRAAGSRAAIGGSHSPAQSSDGAAAGAVAAYHQTAAAVAAAGAAAAAAALPYPPPPDVTFILSQRGNPGRQSVSASRAAQAPGHVVTSVYPTSPPSSKQISPPPPPPPPPPRQEQRQSTDVAAATAEDGDIEAPDSPLKGVVIRSAVASPPTTTAAAAASAAGTLAAAEAWLAAVADQVGFPDVPVAGSAAAAAESFRDITLLPRRQISAAETGAGGAPPMDADAAELPPTPTAVAGANVPSLAGTAETQFRVGASVDSLPPMGLRVPSPQQHLSDSIQGPLPGGSSPKPRDGGSQLPISMGPGATPSGVLSSSATEILRPQSPAVYGSVFRRPATAAAAVPYTSPVPAMNRPQARLVRDAGRAPSQAYGYSVAAGTVINSSSTAAPPAGERQAEVLTIHPPHWESMSQLEADPSYVHYPTITAKGEFGGSVPHPRSVGTFFPPAPQAGPSWRSYLMRSRLSAPGSRGSADWPRSSSAMAAASRAPAASSQADPVGPVNARHPTGTSGARYEAGYRQTGPPTSKRWLWESRAALAAEARGMRAAARLLRAENRRLADEVAALDDSVEGLAQGVLSPEFVRLHAESVERRLEFAEQYAPLVAARGNSRAPHAFHMGPHATEAEAVAAAAAEAAAEVYVDAAAVEAAVAASAAFATAAAEEARLSDHVQARPSSAPPASDSAAAAAPATLGHMGTGGVHGVGTSLDYGRGRGVYGDRAYGGRAPSRSQFRYIAPEELRLRRDLLAELRLRRQLSNALEDSRSAVLDLALPMGSDTDEMIQLIQAVRQQQRSSAGHETSANRQESTNNDNGSGTDPSPQPDAPTAGVLAAMAPVQRHVSFAAGTRGG